MRCTETPQKSGRFLKYPSLIERFRSEDASIVAAHDDAVVYSDGFVLPDPLKTHESDIKNTDGMQDILRLALLAANTGKAKTLREAIVVAFHQKYLEVCRDHGETPSCPPQYRLPNRQAARVNARRRIKRLLGKGLTLENIAEKLCLTVDGVKDIGCTDKRYRSWRL